MPVGKGLTVATQFTHVRVEKTTLLELERIRQQFLNGELMGRTKLEKDTRGRFSLDKVILRLIRELDMKAARNAKYRANKRGGKSTNATTTGAIRIPVAPADSPGPDQPLAAMTASLQRERSAQGRTSGNLARALRSK